MKNLWNNESGAILSAELVLIGTLVVLGVITGLSCLQTAVVDELSSVGAAIRGMNQTYYTPTFRGCWKWWGRTSYTGGSFYRDSYLFGGATSSAEIGGLGYGTPVYGNTGVYTDFGAGTPTVTPGGCPTGDCPGTSTPLLPAPAAPAPVTEPCQTCPSGEPTPGPNGSGIGNGRPIIPAGPVPQASPTL